MAMASEGRVDETGDQFPAGLRVLAVDDEPTCLKVLEILLTSCNYRVRTTNRALEALEILRKNKFDLVISDVCMPDMDGLKLLELVGLEMDLPVIMLSANADPKVVMKGIDHGACDYLLKPIRVEELKIIWQHVVRKKKHKLRNQNNSSNQERHQREGQSSGNADPNEHTSRKRKDQDDGAVEEVDDNGESEDPSAPKKPRVVWTMDLHRKFVYAVNQLGLDKAVPKKILDLMNVERLTRENVASHLQKYRIYLKRMSSAANRQANNMGNPDPNYMRMGGTDGLGSYHAMAGSAFNNYPASGMLGQFNAPAGLGMCGLPSTRAAHMGRAQNSSNDPGKFQLGMYPQGMPTALELEELQNINDVAIGGLSNAIDDMAILAGSSGFPDATVAHGNQSSAAMADHVRASINWPNGYGSQPNPFASGDGFQQASMHRATTLPIGSSSSGAFSTPRPAQFLRTDLHGQAAPNSSSTPLQGLDFYRQDAPYRPNFMGSSIPPANAALGSLGEGVNINLTRQPIFLSHGEADRSGMESSVQRQEGYIPGQENLLVTHNFGSLEDLATAMAREQQNSGNPDGYFGPSSYPPRTSQ